jgi:hypothetical protein
VITFGGVAIYIGYVAASIALVLGVPLAATAAAELLVARAMGVRHRLALRAVFYTNVLTNPLLIGVCGMAFVLNGFDVSTESPWYWPTLLVLEVFVFLAEWQLLRWAAHMPSGQAARLSAVMNLVSFALTPGVLFAITWASASGGPGDWGLLAYSALGVVGCLVCVLVMRTRRPSRSQAAAVEP